MAALKCLVLPALGSLHGARTKCTAVPFGQKIKSAQGRLNYRKTRRSGWLTLLSPSLLEGSCSPGWSRRVGAQRKARAAASSQSFFFRAEEREQGKARSEEHLPKFSRALPPPLAIGSSSALWVWGRSQPALPRCWP